MKKKVKKAFKITGIVLGSLISLLLIAILVAVWFVLTPKRLTPIVLQQAENYISCTTKLNQVELTIFKTFPRIGLKIDNLLLLNPVDETVSDTLLYIDECVVGLNIKELIKNNAIVVNEFYLKNGFANLFVDSSGNTNYNVFLFDNTPDDGGSFSIEKIELDKLTLKNIRANYTDLVSNIQAKTNHLDLVVKGKMKEDMISADVDLKTGNTMFAFNDSLSDLITATGITTKFKGSIAHFNAVKGDLDLSLSDISFKMGDVQYLQPTQLAFELPVDVLIDKQYLALNRANISLNDQHIIMLNGNISNPPNSGDIDMNMAFETKQWDVKEILNLVPDSFQFLLAGIDIEGGLALYGKATGVYNDSLMPVISANVRYENGKLAIAEIPYTFHDLTVDVGADIDFKGLSKLNINRFQGKTGNSSVSCSGTIDDLFNAMHCNLKLDANVYLPDAQPVIPENINLKGVANASLNAKFTMAQMTNMALDQMDVAGSILLTDLDAIYNDSILLKSASTHIDLELPAKNPTSGELLYAKIESIGIDATMIDFLTADVGDVKLTVAVSDFTDTLAPLRASGQFDFGNLKAEMDTISVDITHPSGSFSLLLEEKMSKLSEISFVYKNSNLLAKMGKELALKTKAISLSGSMEHNGKHEDFILQWNPQLKVNLQQGALELSPLLVNIPTIRLDFTPEKIRIRESRIILGNSEFQLSGVVSHLDNYLKKNGLLTAELDFISENTDVFQLMDYISGFGSQADSAAASVSEELENEEDNPFIVPLGIDVTLNTQVKKASLGETLLEDLHGKLTIKDGILVIEEMGFTNDAARMQFTGMYRSPRKNHLYAGIDFHLLDIDIARLIQMIPDIDTIVPMLKSFSGKAEFHFAIETYLKSNYDLKFSTLRGAAAINGQDLILKDLTVLPTISQKLLFKKQNEAKVDSISVEMTVFRNEIDLYPFLISLGKYQAVIDGRHNLDMTYDYHISITETPLPLRLGLNIKGRPEKLKFKVVRCKYAHLYRPEKRGEVDKKTLELKEIISSSLKSGVKE